MSRVMPGGEAAWDRRPWLAVLLPLVVAAVLYLPGIGRRILYEGDEARYALLARTMLETGDWRVPRIGGEVHMEKTPLFIWSIAALSLPGGKVTELTAVLPAALSGIASVGMTMLLARRMFGWRAASLSGFALATTWGYFWFARMALADMMLTFCAMASAAAFWSAVADGGASRRVPMALFWAGLAVGLAAKGPAGLMPLLPAGAFLIAEDGWPGLRKLRPLMGVAIAAVISSSWALGFAAQREANYVQSVLIDDFLLPRVPQWRRFLDPTFAVAPITVGLLPWTPLLPVAIWDGWWRAGTGDGTRRKFRFLVFWALAYAIVMTLLPHHRVRHLLPIFPGLAVMVGWVWDRWPALSWPTWLRLCGWIWAALAVAAAGAIALPFRPPPEQAVLFPPTVAQRLAMAALLVAVALLIIAAARTGRPLALFAAVCVPMALGLALETHVAVAGHNRVFDIRSLSQRLAARASTGDDLVTYRYHPLPIQFYSGRAITRLGEPADLAARAAAGRRLFVVAEDFAWRDLVARTGEAWTVVDRADINGMQLLVGTPAARP
ncbi:MAG TPA: glycosyltransferase family 39 protein [Candidatus Methylomirabilis sp.]|nr:glycosyltransferase family 39 protein [Candidatus Methylomirabilis sp.]